MLVEQAVDTDDFLRLLAGTAVDVVPGAVSATLVLEQYSRDRTVISVGELASAGDEWQFGLADGPGATALRGRAVVDVADMGTEQRWGWYPALASRAGIGSALCLPLDLPQPVSGLLTLYAGRPSALGEVDLAAARSWASRVRAALVVARWIYQSDVKTTQLQHGLRTNQRIGQATGLLMAQAGCTSEVAFAALQKQSSISNTKLRAIAEHLVADHDGAALDLGARAEVPPDAGSMLGRNL